MTKPKGDDTKVNDDVEVRAHTRGVKKRGRAGANFRPETSHERLIYDRYDTIRRERRRADALYQMHKRLGQTEAADRMRARAINAAKDELTFADKLIEIRMRRRGRK